jgi:hypothetical protein
MGIDVFVCVPIHRRRDWLILISVLTLLQAICVEVPFQFPATSACIALSAQFSHSHGHYPPSLVAKYSPRAFLSRICYNLCFPGAT